MKKQTIVVFFYCFVAAVFLFSVHFLGHAVTVMTENQPTKRKNCIVIDAGHGGLDGGAVSCSGKPESFFNLEIACRLNDLLHFLGYDTYMIRTSDISIYTEGSTIAQKKISDLKERVRIVNNTENALLLSIHQNTFSNSQYSGAQVFYATSQGSQMLAEQIQKCFVFELNPGSRRQSKQCQGVYLMEHIKCPGVLIECGFLSNPEEEAKLQSAEYQKKICCVISTSVSQFLSNT